MKIAFWVVMLLNVGMLAGELPLAHYYRFDGQGTIFPEAGESECQKRGVRHFHADHA